MREHSRRFVDGALGDVTVEWGEGFDDSVFNYTDSTLQTPVPVILHQNVMGHRGLEVGDAVHISYRRQMPIQWHNVPAVVVGVHNGHIARARAQEAVAIPLFALRSMLENWMGYISLSFTVDPSRNRDIEEVRSEIGDIVHRNNAGFLPLDFLMLDEELRNVISAIGQSLLLLELLYPIAIALSVVIAAGLSILLMLQNTKNAAIMRVLGGSRTKTQIMLWAEQMALCLFGAAAGLAIIIVMGWGFDVSSSFVLAGMYLGGAAVGSVIGVLLVTNKPPLELLQVRE